MEIIMTNPFFQRAYYVEQPFVFLPDHWVTNKYGYKAFNSANKSDDWVYFIIKDDFCVQATPEFLNDTEIAMLAFECLNLH